MAGLIVIMLDGISADSFAKHRAYMPRTSWLAEQGLVVNRLGAEMCGTSFPGRTSILTGARAARSGIYGNAIWDGVQFRHSTPDDVAVPTLPALAQQAGKDVAVIGFGMVRPEDATVFRAPWWAGTFIQRSRDAQPVPTTEPWKRAVEHQDPTGRIARAQETIKQSPLSIPTDLENKYLKAALGDFDIMDTVGAVAVAPNAPQVIFTEVLIPDTAQHYAGYDSSMALWSFGYADALVGRLLDRLRAAGQGDKYNIAVLSDHGHSPIEKSLRPEAIIPGTVFQTEGSMLHVVPRSAKEAEDIAAKLSEFGAEFYDNAYLPESQRGVVHSYLAPDGHNFESDTLKPSLEPITSPTLFSSHGLRPGHPGDERFMVLAGPDVSHRNIEHADANQVAPTLAVLAGVARAHFDVEALLEPALV